MTFSFCKAKGRSDNTHLYIHAYTHLARRSRGARQHRKDGRKQFFKLRVELVPDMLEGLKKGETHAVVNLGPRVGLDEFEHGAEVHCEARERDLAEQEAVALGGEL
jgi:hypothetical protein